MQALSLRYLQSDSRRSRPLIRYLGILFFLLTWQVVANLVASPLLVPPTDVGPALWALRYDLAIDTLISLRTLMLGYTVAVALGLAMGIVMAKVPPIRLMAMPVVDSARSVAALAFFPLLILILGLGVTAKAFVIFWTAWPAILVNAMHGIDQADRAIIEAATLDGASRHNLLWLIEFPLAMPTIVAGMRIGASGAWISLVASEMLGSSQGLGFAVLSYSQSFQFPAMYAAIVAIAVTGLVVNSSLSILQSYTEKSIL